MESKLADLEKTVSRTVRYIAKLRREAGATVSVAPSAQAPSPTSTARLAEENLRLREERKELRRRIRALIREIDKLKI